MNTKSFSIRAARKISRVMTSRANDYWIHQVLSRAGVSHARKIMSWTTKDELQALYSLALGCPDGSTVLEIGSYLGASTCYIAAGLKQRHGSLFCVDTWNNETMPEGIRDTYAEFCNNTRSVQTSLTIIRQRSEELTPADIPSTLDLVFLDGDHSYDSTRTDFDLVVENVSANGIIAFHDCLFFRGVSKVIGEALASSEWMVGGIVNNLIWIKRANWQK